MKVVVLLVSLAGAHALSTSGGSHMLMRRSQEQRTMMRQDLVQGHGGQDIAAENAHENLVNMEVGEDGSTQGSQTAPTNIFTDQSYVEMPSSGLSGKVGGKTLLQEKTSMSPPLQEIRSVSELAHHARRNPELINDLAESVGIKTLGWTKEQLHAAAHAVHKQVVVRRTESLLQRKSRTHTKLEELHDEVNRMRQLASQAPRDYFQNLSASADSVTGHSMRQQIDEMQKQLDMIRGHSTSDARPSANDSKSHQQMEDIHQQLDALQDEVKLLRGTFQEEVTSLRKKVDEYNVVHELHDIPGTSFLKGQSTSSHNSTIGPYANNNPHNTPWKSMDTGLTKSTQTLGMKAPTMGTYFGVARTMSSFIAKAARGDSITGKDIFTLCHDTLPQLLFLANPILGATVGMAFSFFKGIFFPGPTFITEERLKHAMETLRHRIMEDVEKLIAETTLRNEFSAVTNTFEDLLEELYWVTQMLEDEKTMMDENTFDNNAIMTHLTYQFMLQHQLSMMKRDMFHTQCWEHNEGPSCTQWQEQSGGFLVSWHFVALHLNVLLEICHLQPAYTAAVLGRVKHIGGVYMDHLERSFHVFKAKRMTFLDHLDLRGESCFTGPNMNGPGTCTIRNGYDRMTGKKTWQVSDLWGQSTDLVKVDSWQQASEHTLNVNGNAEVVLENCCNCGCSREHCDEVLRTSFHKCRIDVRPYCQDEPALCKSKWEGEDTAHYENINEQLDAYLRIINEIKTGLREIPEDFGSGQPAPAPAPAPAAHGGTAPAPAPFPCVMTWQVVGTCMIDQNCVSTPYYPTWYPSSTECSMTAQCDCACKVSSNGGGFNTEQGYDILTINGQQFSGQMEIPPLDTQGNPLVFIADHTVNDDGFKLCLHESALYDNAMAVR